MIKKILLCFVMTMAIFLSFGCSKKTNSDSRLTLWCEASAAKILQNDEGEAAKTATEKQTLKINMAKNESEGVQLMMYANEDIADYDVSVSDLTSGKNVIKASAIDVYMVKYVFKEPGVFTDGNPDFPAGSYIPDALLPFDTAAEYEETIIKKGNNQSIYFDVTTEADTPAGVYTGKVRVQIGKSEYEMPMEVTVYDVVYPDTSKLKTAYSMFDSDTFASAELDGSSEKYATYYETLLKYNMACALPFEGEGGVEKYLELLKKYYDYPGFSSYRLYYASGSSYKGESGPFNGDLMGDYLLAIAEMSVEEKVDYLDKAYFYGYNIVDEPRTPEQFSTARSLQRYWEKILKGTDAVLQAKYAGTEDYEYYASVVSKSLLTIPNVMPGSYTAEESKEMLGITYVPIIDNFSLQSERELYRELSINGELWTYTCVGPKYPYPSAHTDDSALGFRLTSWMCFDYNLDAFLMWASTHYVQGINGDVVSDPWNSINTGFQRPGDGKYFYPGAKYGLNEPCPTITAMQYRDGVDDYSLLQAIRDVYSAFDMDEHTILTTYFEQLYNGTVPTTDYGLFESIRQELFKIAEELLSDTAVVYATKTLTGATVHVEMFTVNEEAEVLVDGQKVNKGEDGRYIFDIDIQESSIFKYTVKCDSAEKTYEEALINGTIGAVADFEAIDSVEGMFESGSAGFALDIYKGTAFANNSNGSLHISVNKDKENIIPYFSITKDSSLLASNWDNIKNMQFMVYNASKEDAVVSLTYFDTQETMLETVTLSGGSWTKIEVVVPDGLDLSTVSEFSFNFERESAVNLYVDDVVVIVKGE